MSEPKTMITTIEVAQVLGVTPRTVQRHIEEGRLQAHKYGRDFFVAREEVERFKRERRHVGRPKKKMAQ
jgi:excisionase family DNA binding protein